MSRNKRKQHVVSNEENKKNRVTVWSEEDDISLLKGMIVYEVSKQSNPYADMGKFLDFIKPFLHFDVQRKQLTDRLWKLKDRYLKSNYDISKPHHAKLSELSRSIKSWGGLHANMSLDGQNVVTSDGQNVEEDNEFVDDVEVDKSSKVVQNEKKGKFVASGVEDDVAIDDDVHVNKGLKVVKKKRKTVSKDDQNVNDQVDNVVVDVNGDRSSKVVENKIEGKFVTGDGGNGIEDDVQVTQDLKVVKKKKKRKGVSKGAQNEKKGKFVPDDDRSGTEDDVAIDDDVQVNQGLEVGKKRRNLVIRDGVNEKEDDVVVDDVNGRQCSKVAKKKKKGKAVTCDCQNEKEDGVVVEDVAAEKSEQVVSDKNEGVTCDDENVEEDNVVADVIRNEKMGTLVTSDGGNGEKDDVAIDDDVPVNHGLEVVKKKRKLVTKDGKKVKEVNAVADDMRGEVGRKNLKIMRSLYPELTNILELETLSRMPQNIKEKCVIDTIYSMGTEKANKLEKEWTDVRLKEMELDAKKLDLASKQINLILEARRRREAELQPLPDDDNDDFE